MGFQRARGDQSEGRRIYRLTPEGLRVCTDGTKRILTDATPQPAPVLIGMANSPLLPPDEVAAALNARRRSLAAWPTASVNEESSLASGANPGQHL